MGKKAIPYILLAVFAVLVLILRRCIGSAEPVSAKEKRSTAKSTQRGFNRTVSYLDYTEHALCRMDCRKISKNDIKDIMRDGDINYKKSNVNQTPCPVYAVQGYTNDREHLRVVFAQCDNVTKVITCYNLDVDFECHCPGDEKK